MSGSGISWATCKSAPRSRQITTPAPHHSRFFTGRMPFLSPNQQRQSTEGNSNQHEFRQSTIWHLSPYTICHFKQSYNTVKLTSMIWLKITKKPSKASWADMLTITTNDFEEYILYINLLHCDSISTVLQLLPDVPVGTTMPWHASSKTLHQQNPPVLNWRCRLMQADLYNSHKIVWVVVLL